MRRAILRLQPCSPRRRPLLAGCSVNGDSAAMRTAWAKPQRGQGRRIVDLGGPFYGEFSMEVDLGEGIPYQLSPSGPRLPRPPGFRPEQQPTPRDAGDASQCVLDGLVAVYQKPPRSA
jgi:hypothetical protein